MRRIVVVRMCRQACGEFSGELALARKIASWRGNSIPRYLQEMGRTDRRTDPRRKDFRQQSDETFERTDRRKDGRADLCRKDFQQQSDETLERTDGQADGQTMGWTDGPADARCKDLPVFQPHLPQDAQNIRTPSAVPSRKTMATLRLWPVALLQPAC